MAEIATTERKTEYGETIHPVDIALNEGSYFHDPSGDAYATILIDGHFECWPVLSRQYKQWLSGRAYQVSGKPPTKSSIKEAVEIVEAHAIFEEEEQLVFLRSARLGDEIFYDLGNHEWTEIRVSSSGWTIGESHSVNFVRNADMQELPIPVPGGGVESLRPLLNIGSDEEWHLYVGFILAALNPDGPYPILVVQGEQGSAKTSLTVASRRLIDPSRVPEQGFTKDGRNIMIAAKHNSLVCFDNVSQVPQDISDLLCRLSTGAGYRHRTLFSDFDEISFTVIRPIILNGIEEFVVAPDLADRSIHLFLERIPDNERVTIADFWERFDEIAPEVMGALLDAVVLALRVGQSRKPNELPRIADAAVWVDAGEPALGFETGSFLKALKANRDGQRRATVDLNPVADAIKKWFESRDCKQIELIATEVIDAITPHIRDERLLPPDGRGMSTQLARVGPVLEAVNIRVKKLERTGSRRLWQFSPIE